MKKIVLALFVALLLLPGTSFAGSGKHGRGFRGPGFRGHHTTVIRKTRHYDGGAIAAGVLGGLLTHRPGVTVPAISAGNLCPAAGLLSARSTISTGLSRPLRSRISGGL